MFLGIEIGGTKLQLGLGPGDGTLAGLWRGEVRPADGAQGIRRQIADALPQLLASVKFTRDDLRGIGVGFGGPVDDSTQTVIKSHQIDGWDDFPLADWIADLVGSPVVLGNDADVAGLAEARFGAGKGLSPIFYVTVGSGIGGALIVNGAIYRGCGRGAAEVGHLRVTNPHSPGQATLLEDISSGWAIQRAAQNLGRPGVTTAQLAEDYARGDPDTVRIFHHAIEALAEGLCSVIALLCPRRIVLGGGVSLLGEQLLFKPLRCAIAQGVFRPFAPCCDVMPAALGETVVVQGALALAAERFGQ